MEEKFFNRVFLGDRRNLVRRHERRETIANDNMQIMKNILKI